MGNKKQLLALDGDMVIFDWISAFTGYAISKGHQLDLNNDRSTYSMHTWFTTMSEVGFKELVVEYNSHEHPPLFAGVIDIIPKLLEKYEVCVVSSYSSCPDTSARRKNILLALGIHNIFLLDLGESKLETLQEIGADIFVDDSVKHMKEGLEAGCEVYTIEYPYNKGVDGVKYIKSLEELL